MKKASFLNILLFLLSLGGAAAAFVFGEVLLTYIAYLPYWVQCGVYLLFVMAVCCVTMVISEKIHTGNYLMKQKKEFGLTSGKVALIFLPAALALGMVTQLLYGWLGLSSGFTPRFQGTMIVCDISGSMSVNDPMMDTVEGMLSYIDTVPLGDHLGIVLFNHDTRSLREYAPLNDEAEREALKQLVYEEVYYDGGTNIDKALLEAIAEMRTLEDPNWPGLILFFSDGGRGDCDISYDLIRRASVGDAGNPKNSIPVNTIYYSPSPLSGSHMNLVAQNTGGTYVHVGVGGDAGLLQDVFKRSRTEFKIDSPHLIRAYYGPARGSAFRIFLQILFLALWGVFSGVMITVFLNNHHLFRHFLIQRIAVAVLCGAAFTLMLLRMEGDFAGILGRGLLAAGMCVMCLPTYRWD